MTWETAGVITYFGVIAGLGLWVAITKWRLSRAIQQNAEREVALFRAGLAQAQAEGEKLLEGKTLAEQAAIINGLLH